MKKWLDEDSDFLFLPVDELHANPAQPPDRITESAVKLLTENILASRYIAPIVVMKVRGRYIIVDGHRRWTAARLIGRERVPCVLIKSQATAEILFVWLNGGIRNVTGGNWFYVWAVSENPDETLEHLSLTHRHHIEDMIAIFGKTRALEIGMVGSYAPSRAKFINSLIFALQQYDFLPNPNQTQRRRIGEWVIKHRQTGAINQKLVRTDLKRHVVARFYRCIQTDRPVVAVKERKTKQTEESTATATATEEV